jgi:uncharacterized protein YjdB
MKLRKHFRCIMTIVLSMICVVGLCCPVNAEESRKRLNLEKLNAPSSMDVKENTSVFTGNTAYLYANYNYAESIDMKTTFNVTSGNENIETSSCTDNGIAIRGLKAGTAVICVTSEANPSLTKNATITVKDAQKVTSLNFSSDSVTFKANASSFPLYESIPFTAEPNDIDYSKLKTTSGDPSILSVGYMNDNSVSVQLLKAGTTTLTLSSEDNVKAEISVTAVSGKYATGFKPEMPNTVTIKPVEKFDFDKFIKQYLVPDDSSEEKISYSINSLYSSAVIDKNGILSDPKEENFTVKATLESGVCTFIQVYVLNEVTKFQFGNSEYTYVSDVGSLSMLSNIQTNLQSAYSIPQSDIQWTSSNTNAVQSDEYGNLQVKGKGDTTITAKYKDFSTSTTVHIVDRKAPTMMSIGSNSSMELYLGQTGSLSAYYGSSQELLDTNTDFEVTEGSDVIEISKDNYNPAYISITTKAVGEAEIKVTSTANKSLSKTMKVVVKDAVKPTKISFTQSEATTALSNGVSPNNVPFLSYSIEPYAASFTAKISYSFDGPSDLIDQVNIQQGIVSYCPVKAGTTKLVLTSDNGLTASIIITVLDGDYASGFSTWNISDKKLKVSETYDFASEINSLLEPLNSAHKDEKVRYTINSWDKSCSVDEKGKVTALKQGRSTVTATLTNGKSIYANFYVMSDISSMQFTKDELYMASDNMFPTVDSLLRFNKDINTSDIPANEIKWSSSNTEVASFNNPTGGMFAINGTGDTEITASYGDLSTSILLHIIDRKVPTAFDCVDQLTVDVGMNSSLPFNYVDNDTVYSDTDYEVLTGSDNIKIQNVDENGISVHGVKAGNASIRLTSKYNKNLQKTVKIIVEDWGKQTSKTRLLDTTGKNLLKGKKATVVFGKTYTIEHIFKDYDDEDCFDIFYSSLDNSSYLQGNTGGGDSGDGIGGESYTVIPSKLGKTTIQIDKTHSIQLNIVSEPVKVHDVVSDTSSRIDDNLIKNCLTEMSNEINSVSSSSEKDNAVSSIISYNPLHSNVIVDEYGNVSKKLVGADTNFYTSMNTDLKGSTLKFDITPTVQVKQDSSTIELGKKELNVNESIDMKLPVGNLVKSSVKQVYVLHTKEDGTQYLYIADVSNGVAEFKNSDGFSTFEVLLDKKVNSENTKELQKSVNTSDSENLLLYMGIAAIALLLAASVIVMKKKHPIE